jgi:hypothetical protein
MDVLIARIAALLLIAAAAPAAMAALSQDGEMPDPRDQLAREQAKSLCRSTDEYIKTLTFLRSTKDIIVPEASARLVAEKVSRGCDGAADRFIKILRLMKTTGLSDPKALEIGLRFSSYSPDVQKNFSEIFSRAFLAEFFDYDYALAVGLALELSRDYRGDPAQVRDDFIELTRFCKDGKNLDLPGRICAEYAIKLARLSELYPHGVRRPFLDLYKRLREDRDFGMDVKTALEISYKVLKNGPRAEDNFMSGYAFAMKETGLGLGRHESLQFALKMAARSYQGEEPPALRAPAEATTDANEP